MELNADYVHDLRRERMKRHQRPSTGSSSSTSSSSSSFADMSNSDGLMSNDSSRVKDAKSVKTFGDTHRRTDSTDSTQSQVQLFVTTAVLRALFYLFTG